MDNMQKTFLKNLVAKIGPPESNDKKAKEIASCLSTGALKQQIDDMRDNIDDFQGEEKSDLELQLRIFETEFEGRANAA